MSDTIEYKLGRVAAKCGHSYDPDKCSEWRAGYLDYVYALNDERARRIEELRAEQVAYRDSLLHDGHSVDPIKRPKMVDIAWFVLAFGGVFVAGTLSFLATLGLLP